MVATKGIEPLSTAYRAADLPLNYVAMLARDEGFEPSTRGFGGRRSTTELISYNGATHRDRTGHPLLTKEDSHLCELQWLKWGLVHGVEPATSPLQKGRSAVRANEAFDWRRRNSHPHLSSPKREGTYLQLVDLWGIGPHDSNLARIARNPITRPVVWIRVLDSNQDRRGQRPLSCR